MHSTYKLVPLAAGLMISPALADPEDCLDKVDS